MDTTSMDQSIRGLPDPIAGAPTGERRRRVRQKLHTPVYASFNDPQIGMVVDLSELLDLNEDGFAVQTSERLEVNRAVTLCLDLPETKSYIHSSGQVMWSDDSGRGGIRFSGLSESSRQILKEWLFANLLIACSNHAARTEQRERCEEEAFAQPGLVSKASNVVPSSDQSEIPSPADAGLAPSPQVEAVRREVGEIEIREIEIQEIDGDVDAVLQRITERALSLTGASGAALALLTNDRVICRARAGEPAPPLGAPVDVTRGLSGECVRSGHFVACEDTENDPRIDPEICRTLGIGSIMAAPVVSNFRVVGLLEVFSPQPRAFTKAHATMLDRLVEMVPKTHCEEAQPGNVHPENTHPETAQPEAPIGSDAASAVPDSPVEPGLAPSPVTMKSRVVGVDAAELGSMHANREALWELEPEASERLSQPIPGESVAVQVPVQVLEPPPAAPSNWFHLGLLGLAVAVVAMAAGYLVGPAIEKRRANSPQASQRSLQLQVQRAQLHSLVDLRKLADQGDAEAQFQMGVRYHNGEDVPQDDTQAMQWFLRSAEQGYVDAQSHLGAYYWAGRGVPEDLSKAYFWSAIAFAEGDDNSKSRLEGLASQMTQAQVSDARQQAEVWLRSHNQRAKSEAN
ncbi:MAG TPA: GAF domain-containing protein [Terriglobales bacterium]